MKKEIICKRRAPRNIDCKNCGIKKIVESHRDSCGTYHLSETSARSEGLLIQESPKNAWTGQLRQKTAECQRGKNGITMIIS